MLHTQHCRPVAVAVIGASCLCLASGAQECVATRITSPAYGSAFGHSSEGGAVLLGINSKYTADTSGGIAIANVIPSMGAISPVNLLMNDIGVDQAKALISIPKEHSTLKSLCGNTGNETELDMSSKMYGAGDAIMLVPEIIDNGAMTSLNLSSNRLGAEGAKIVAEAIKVTMCTPAIIMAPFSCSSDFSISC